MKRIFFIILTFLSLTIHSQQSDTINNQMKIANIRAQSSSKQTIDKTLNAKHLFDIASKSFDNYQYDLSLKQFLEIKTALEQTNQRDKLYTKTIFKILDLLYLTKNLDNAEPYFQIIEERLEQCTDDEQQRYCVDKISYCALKEGNFKRIPFIIDSIQKKYGCTIDETYLKLMLNVSGDNNKIIEKSTSDGNNTEAKDYSYLLLNFETEYYRVYNFYSKKDYPIALELIVHMWQFIQHLDSTDYKQTNIGYYDMAFKVNVLYSEIINKIYSDVKTMTYRNLLDVNIKKFYSTPNLPRSFIYETYDYLAQLTFDLGLYKKSLDYIDTCLQYNKNNFNRERINDGFTEYLLNDRRIGALYNLSQLSDSEFLDNLLQSYNYFSSKMKYPNVARMEEILKYAYLTNNKIVFEKFMDKYLNEIKNTISNDWIYKNIYEQEVYLDSWENLETIINHALNLKVNEKLINDAYCIKLLRKKITIGNAAYLNDNKYKNVVKYEKIKMLQDKFVRYSKMTLEELTNNNITDGIITELNKSINFETTKFLQETDSKSFNINNYNIDTIRKYLKDDECFVFYSYNTLNNDSTKFIKKFVGFIYGISFKFFIDGLCVEKITEKSPASLVIMPTDRIIAVNNKNLSDLEGMADEIYSNISMNIKVVRDMDTLEFHLKKDSVFESLNFALDNYYLIDKNLSTPIFVNGINPADPYIKNSFDTLYKNYQKGLKQIEDKKEYAVLFKPLIDKIKKYKTVYYSLSGLLTKINLEQIYNSETKRYLSEDFNFYNCPLLDDFYKLKQTNKNIVNQNIAIFGNPDLTQFSQMLSQNTNRTAWEDIAYYYSDSIKKMSFSNLPYTKNEIEAINVIGKSNGYSPTVYSEMECTETNIKKLKSPQILHIATHGYFFNDNNNTFVNQYSSISSSLLNTGLILSEAKSKTDVVNDGYLSAYEILNLDLRNTELVVLSACETSLGSYNYIGNDDNSLQLAFRLAGAKSVLASKWKVPDRQTQELMVEFYSNWLDKKMTKHNALQQAQMTIRKKYPEPYYWAAWVLFGE